MTSKQTILKEMIQRIQTVYLLISAILLIVCSAMPLAAYQPTAVESPTLLYNLCTINGASGEWSFSSCGLLAILLATVVTSILNIFGYKNRKRQMNRCLIAIILLVVWHALFIYLLNTVAPENSWPEIRYTALLPFIAIFLQWLARIGIKRDDDLIKSMDRIR